MKRHFQTCTQKHDQEYRILESINAYMIKIFEKNQNQIITDTMMTIDFFLFKTGSSHVSEVFQRFR